MYKLELCAALLAMTISCFWFFSFPLYKWLAGGVSLTGLFKLGFDVWKDLAKLSPDFIIKMILKVLYLTPWLFVSSLLTVTVVAIIIAFADKRCFGRRTESIGKMMKNGFSCLENEILRNTVYRECQKHIAYKNMNTTIDSLKEESPEGHIIDSISALLTSMLDTVFGVTGNARAIVYVSKNSELESFCHARNGTSQDPPKTKKLPLNSVAGHSFNTQSPITFDKNAKKTLKKKFHRTDGDDAFKSFFCAPIVHDRKVWGVLSIDTNNEEFPISNREDTLFIENVADNIGFVINRFYGAKDQIKTRQINTN